MLPSDSRVAKVTARVTLLSALDTVLEEAGKVRVIKGFETGKVPDCN